jgi:hypothetical protein
MLHWSPLDRKQTSRETPYMISQEPRNVHQEQWKTNP